MSMHNPLHPGEFIRKTYIEPFDFSARILADKLGVSASTLNRVKNGQSGVSPSMALRLSKVLGIPPECWISMQYNHNLWKARKSTDLTDVQVISFRAA